MNHPTRNNDDLHYMDKGELADELLARLAAASPDGLNGFTAQMKRKGGKFALLARVLTGETSVDDPEWEKYNAE